MAVLSVFPLFAVSSAVIGGDIREAIVARMGLNAQATRDVDTLIASGNQAIATLTWVSAVVLVLGGIGMASTLSAWYHRIYERTPSEGLPKRLVYQAAGVVAFVLYISAEVWLFDKVRPAGGRGLIFLLTFVFAVLFWWLSTYMPLVSPGPATKSVPCRRCNGSLHHRSRSGLVRVAGRTRLARQSKRPRLATRRSSSPRVANGRPRHRGRPFGC